MAEGFITRRGGVSSEQALAPTITFVSKTDSQIVFTIKNNDDATAVILWELDDATPDANSLELAADTTSSNITVTGLDDDTEFIVYATANVTGKVKSNVSQLSITTDETPTFIDATGGTTTTYTSGGKFYKSHTFTSGGNFVVNSLSNQSALNEVDYLIIAGGGGGGIGGGGAGGYRTTNGTSGGNSSAESKVAVTAQTYGITIGGGGNGSTSESSFQGFQGNNSVALGITSTGGGSGGGSVSDRTTRNGGSGGGSRNASGETGLGGFGIAGQGSNGGSQGADGRSGGGGGAGQAGSDFDIGGDGLANLLRTGSNETRAGGGGGFNSGTGGSGGGGDSTENGVVNTGGGGGGSGAGTGANGGSGIVIIRYEVGGL